MTRNIPGAVLALAADYAAYAESSHAKLESLLMHAGCPGDPPDGSMQTKALSWLRQVNKDPSCDPLSILGRTIENYMDAPLEEGDYRFHETEEFRRKMTTALASAKLQYRQGGIIVGSLDLPTKTLAVFIKERNVAEISEEFERAARKAESEPREAVSAAANILESICKHYIEAEKLSMPSKQTLKELWNVVRKDLGFDPSQVADDDLKVVLVGLIQIVDGLGAFRTHASSAHGSGPKSYRLQPRHSRLAVHSAHTAALFILESWDNKRKSNSSA
jgi:hypothetical protein